MPKGGKLKRKGTNQGFFNEGANPTSDAPKASRGRTTRNKVPTKAFPQREPGRGGLVER